jgi:hypothetical protein
LTEGWHPLILYPREECAAPAWQPDPWSYREQSPEIETALAFLDGLRQTLGSDALLVWKLERLMEEHGFSPAQYWRFRAEFLLEFWQAEPHSIEDLLEGRALAAGRRPFVLVYQNGVELWSRPPRPSAHFREDEEPACEDHRYSSSPIRKEFGK